MTISDKKELKKREILSQRIKFLQKISPEAQKEVERCFACIDSAQTDEELLLVKFMSPSVPENL